MLSLPCDVQTSSTKPIFDLLEAFAEATAVVRTPKDKKHRSTTAAEKRELMALAVNEICEWHDGPEVRRALYSDFKLDYQVHHIVPRELGGGNDFNNLALVRGPFHKLIHKYIDRQHRMKFGETGELLIPRLPGKVWTYNIG